MRDKEAGRNGYTLPKKRHPILLTASQLLATAHPTGFLRLLRGSEAPIDAPLNSRHLESRHYSTASIFREVNPMRHALGVLLALFVVLTACHHQVRAAGELKSGPQPGESLPGPFHYLNVNGPHAGNPHCLVCEFGLRPSVLVFTREIPAEKSPLMDLIQRLDEAVDRHKNSELARGRRLE